MKKLWLFWWMVNIFWVVIFAVGTAFVWLREVDGAGVTQTFEGKLAAFIVLLIAFIFPLLIQVVWLIVNLVMNSNKKTKIHQG
jgi:ABC-type multidrug transport system fused ATPase/permease subunit